MLSSGGLGVTFLESPISDFWLQSIAFKLDKVYAKVLFTNLIETKAGLSPDCLKEDKGDRNNSDCWFNHQQSLQEKS